MISTSSSRLNYNNAQISEEITNYDNEKGMITIKGGDDSLYGITNTELEKERFSNYKSNPDGLSIVILGNCENLLRTKYGIDKNLALIIKKYEQITISAKRNVQFEVYHPITKKKLDLSICDKEQIHIYVPVELTEDLLKLYYDLKKYGYDLFNINDPFYNDICSPYTSINKTSVLLLDRKNDYYIASNTTCQSNCRYASLFSEKLLLDCECKVIAEDIDVNNKTKFNQKILKYFFEEFENTNFQVMKCYKLVFNWKYLRKNIGSFIVIGLFFIYLIFFIFYLVKGIKPLKKVAKKRIDKIVKGENLQTNYFPPKKKSKSLIIENDSRIIKKKKRRRKSGKRRSKKGETTIDKSNNNKDLIKSRNKLNPLEESKTKSELNAKNKIEEENIINNKDNKDNKKNKKNKKHKKNKKYDDLDLNNFSYEKALELDKRKFPEVYWARLKHDHLIIFTFTQFHDYNLIYIKFSRFVFLVTTSMAFTVLFFFDSSMHKIYKDHGKYTFFRDKAESIYSFLVSFIIEILIGYLSYTDVNIYQIRQLKKVDKIKKVLKRIKQKLIVFYVVTFLLFLFYWYLISCFCAVYKDTQIIYIKKCIKTFINDIFIPFVIHMAFAFGRIFALKQNTKFRSLLYKVC